MNDTSSKIATFAMTLLLLSACSKKNEDSTLKGDGLRGILSINEDEALIESAITGISGMADDSAPGAGYAGQKTIQNKWQLLFSLMSPDSVADNCVRPIFQTCNSGEKSSQFEDCAINFSPYTLSGLATLNFTQSNCSLNQVQDSVTRTYSLSIDGPHGGSYWVTSSNNTDYRGIDIGGGGKLTRTATGWDIDVLGKHNILYYNGNIVFFVSQRTLSPVHVSGSLTRHQRIVNGGQLEVSHFLAEYTSVLSFNNLQWTNSCCHPTSGSIDVSYSGSLTGTAQVDFTSTCGQANLTRNGSTKKIQLNLCE